MTTQHDEQEFPTREQMERVQELAKDGASVEVSPDRETRRISCKADGVRGRRVFDEYGVDVSESAASMISTLSTFSIPIGLVRRLLGDEAVDAALVKAEASWPGDEGMIAYCAANLLAAVFAGVLGILLDVVQQADAEDEQHVPRVQYARDNFHAQPTA